jgi:hypothetical protein
MAQAARKITAKDANAKLALRRLTVLELAERLGNVAEACRAAGSTGPASTTGNGASGSKASTASRTCRRSPRAIR